MTDSWFSYLQAQICKEFESFEKKKFIRRDWSKKNKMKEVVLLLSYLEEIYLKK